MEDDNKRLNTKIRRNYFLTVLIFGIVTVIIVTRAFSIYIKGDKWRKLGAGLSKPNVEVPATRGNIYSCDGQLMATTESMYRLYMDFWADGVNGDSLVKYIHPLSLNLHKLFPDHPAIQYYSQIMRGWQMRKREEKRIDEGRRTIKRSREYKILFRDVNYLQYQAVKNMPYFNLGTYKSGLYSKEMVRRTKPFGSLASRTIGDIYGEYDKGGKNGLELEYNSLLKGIPGTSTRKKISGKIMDVIDIPPENGEDIYTTIDIDIQDITEKALRDELRKDDAESGTAVVMEVNTGAIRAITNLARYRDSLYLETKNMAVADESEPGSTFKTVSMMVALDDGLVHPNDTVNTGNGLFEYGGQVVVDHNANKGGYGKITAAQAIWYSSNVGVSKLILKGYKNQPEKFVDGIYRIGINKPLHLEIPGAGRAYIRSPRDKTQYWARTTLPWMSFGYETKIPPIYMLTFYNAIANEGKMIEPYFVQEIRKNDKVVMERETKVINPQICKPRTLAIIQQMLLDVVRKGTGKPAEPEGFQAAGKTGTAQISHGSSGYKSGGVKYQVSFCGYFPADHPKYSCIVVIRKPRKGYPGGGLMCGTVFKNIAEQVAAKDTLLLVSQCPKDSLHAFYPLVKNGITEYSRYMLDKLSIPYRNLTKAPQSIYESKDTLKITLKERKLIKNTVPDVIGMGAKDAVYLLEKNGLRTVLSGYGAVKSQSIPPGTKINKGQTILISLK